MIEAKNFSGRLDLDSSPYRVAPNDFIDALNVTKDAVEGSNDKVLTNIVGNQIVVPYTYHSGGTATIIGSYANTVRNTVIVFAYHTAGYHVIWEYNNTTRTNTKIFENLTDSADVDVLGFTLLGKITSVNIYNRDEGDLLYFLDSLGRPTGLNILEFKAGTYTPVTRQILNVIKAPPLSPPSYVYGNDTTRRVNNTRNRFFRFQYLFIYDDFEESVCSPMSAVNLPVSLLDDTYTSVVTNNNVITVSMDSGAKNVKSVQLLMSYAQQVNEWTPYEIVDTIVKADESIADDTTFSYLFYNDSTYPLKDPQQSILLFDYVPDSAYAQEMPNGNVLMYSGITEGLNRSITPNVVNTVSTYLVSAPTTGSLDVVLSLDETVIVPVANVYRKMRWTFSGVPAVGTNVTVSVQRKSDHAVLTAASYTTVSGDTISNIVSFLASHIVVPDVTANDFGFLELYMLEATYEPLTSTGKYSSITITAPTSSVISNSIATWKWSTERNIGIAYFDQNGKTNGILYNAKITFPAFANNTSGDVYLPTINTKIYHQPPDWAYSYNFYFTKEGTSYIFWESVAVNIAETNFIYFDVTDFVVNALKNPTTSTVLSYSFQDGDRMRLIQPVGQNTYFADTYDAAVLGLVVEPTINGVVQTGKRFIKIKKSSPFSNSTFTPNNQTYTIELYRPEQKTASDKNETYYEFGQQYPILNPTTATRIHGGMVQDQSTDYVSPAEFNFTKGDSYFRARTIALTDTGTGTFVVQDRNIVDFYLSAVSSIDGRPNLIDINAKTKTFGATTRFGQAIQANTNINGLNRFYPNDLIDCDISYGNIVRLKVRDRFVRVFQQLKVGMMPIFSQINKSNDGTTVNVVTDKLLNPVQYYIGDVGIGDNPESLASFNYADYFTSNIKGVICRASNNGIEMISLLYLINSWATEHLPQRGSSYKMYGAFDQRLGNYILALEATATDPAYTILFDEENNGFETFLSYHPEMMVTLGTLFISFKNGQLYTHDATSYNTFYGTSYDSTITPVFNQNHLEKKTFHSIEEVASQIWDCPEITTSLNSYGTTKQSSRLNAARFVPLEGNFHSSFLRDANSNGGLINGSLLKGNYVIVKFRAQQPTNLVTLDLCTVSWVDSPLTTK